VGHYNNTRNHNTAIQITRYHFDIPVPLAENGSSILSAVVPHLLGLLEERKYSEAGNRIFF
jgi:hypothetical protein